MTCRKGWPYLLGGPFEFEQRPLFGIQVGEKISAIGRPAKSGKTTSSSRCTEFIKPVTFCGFYHGPGGTAGTTYAAFLLDNPTVEGWDLFNQPQPIWQVWAVSEIGKELLLQNFRTRSILIHKAHFTK